MSMHEMYSDVVEEDQNGFRTTKAYDSIVGFLEEILRHVSKHGVSTAGNVYVDTVLLTILQVVNETPKSDKIARYGNLGFIDVVQKLEGSQILLGTIGALKSTPSLEKHTRQEVVDVLMKYLLISFGNKTRIDYGTGHELNFLCFLYCLYVLGQIDIGECTNALDMYFALVRKILLKYNLEPAGSTGLWGIDDYQLLPFLIGAAECIESTVPCQDFIADPTMYRKRMYARALDFVSKQKGKSGSKIIPFSEHSPLLVSIAVFEWPFIFEKIKQEYFSNVFKKQVTQHFFFSIFLPSERGSAFK